jgi:hypothetical protein
LIRTAVKFTNSVETITTDRVVKFASAVMNSRDSAHQ